MGDLNAKIGGENEGLEHIMEVHCIEDCSTLKELVQTIWVLNKPFLPNT
jgi:hypothetical protein